MTNTNTHGRRTADDRDRDIMVGHPAGDPANNPDDVIAGDLENQGGGGQETLVNVQVGGREFQVPEGFSEALVTDRRETQDRINELEARFDNRDDDQRNNNQQDPDQDAIAMEFLKDPSKFIGDIVSQSLGTFREDFTKENKEANALSEFWSMFDRNHPEFANHRDLVSTVFRANYNEIGKLNPKEASDKLAEITQGHVSSLFNSLQGGGNQQGGRDVVIGGTNPQNLQGNQDKEGDKDKEDDNKPYRIIETLRERKRLREEPTAA